MPLTVLTQHFFGAGPGFFKCGHKGCETCNQAVPSKTFNSSVTGKEYHIRSKISCNTLNLIYLVTCKKCGIQYVGMTKNRLRTRINGHRYDIRNKLDKPVARHFNSDGHSLSDMSVQGIEKITGLQDSSLNLRLKREAFWIYELKTLNPEGINIMDYDFSKTLLSL